MKKKICFVFFILFVFVDTKAQAQGIRVVYQEQMNPVTNIQSDNPEIVASIKAQMGSMKKIMCLYYNKGESIYKPMHNTEKEPDTNQPTSGMKIIMTGSDVCVYKNQKSKEIISQEYIMDKKFLITDSMKTSEWVLSDEVKEISNYKCRKAVSKDGTTTVWYCPDIPVNDGPYLFRGLPGLIMQAEHFNKTVTVQELTPINDTDNIIKKPTDGKKITRNEFEKTIKKKMEEMGAPSQGVNVNVDIIKM